MKDMNTGRTRARCLLALLLALPLSVAAFAQDTQDSTLPSAPPQDANVQAARLSDVEGSVQVIDAGGQAFDESKINMPMLPGMQIKTGNDGRAEVQFPDGSLARVTPNSTLQLSPLPRGASSGAPALKVAAGLTYFETPADTTGLIVQVGPETVTPAAGSLVRVSMDTEPAQVAVLRGGAHFASGAPNTQPDTQDVQYDLQANQTASIDLHSVMNYDVSPSVSSDSWDAWNTDRDQALSELASTQTAARQDSGDAGDLGWNDLDYYGSWYDVPGYGMAWAPDNAGADFDPYGSGYWGYYTTVGYTWISAYPWGWLPYHCGRWSYFGGSGWLWLPGGCSPHRWLPYPPVRRGPNGYRPPQPVALSTRRFHLAPVNRAPMPAFRLLGEPKATPRELHLRSDAAQALVALPLPVYSTFSAGPTASSYRQQYSVTRPITVTPGRTFVSPQPVARPYVPAPVARPAPPVSAPRYEAPHAAPAPAGHPH